MASDSTGRQERSGFARLLVIFLAVVAVLFVLALLVVLGALSFLMPVSSSVSY